MGIQMSRRKYRSRTLQQPHLTSMSTQNYRDEVGLKINDIVCILATVSHNVE